MRKFLIFKVEKMKHPFWIDTTKCEMGEMKFFSSFLFIFIYSWRFLSSFFSSLFFCEGIFMFFAFSVYLHSMFFCSTLKSTSFFLLHMSVDVVLLLSLHFSFSLHFSLFFFLPYHFLIICIWASEKCSSEILNVMECL